ncbi:serine/threonine protein kinase [Planoprotostelium fungivorum]|uniref:Serine/threonine protein kinase n=1 Tax=Planoprotostelium fungivorum TaxID=1890364 RepID=A0A2P6NY52_9EUKA|nr:serine/threonine protein kinase [Planoprotostelium fungivorum]
MRPYFLLVSCFLSTFLFVSSDEGFVAENGLSTKYCGYTTSRMHATGNWLSQSPYNQTGDWAPDSTAILVPQLQYGILCLWSLNVTGLPPNTSFDWKVAARGDWAVGNWGCPSADNTTMDSTVNCQFTSSSNGTITLNMLTSGSNSSFYRIYTGLVPLSEAIVDPATILGRGSNLEPVTDGWNNHPACGYTNARYKASGDWTDILYGTGIWNAASTFGNMTAMLNSGVECLLSITLQGLPANATYSWKVVAGGDWNYANWGCAADGVSTFAASNCNFTTNARGSIVLNIITSGNDTTYRLYTTDAPVTSPDNSVKSPENFPTWAIAVIAAVGAVFVISIIIVIIVVRKKRNEKSRENEETADISLLSNALKIDFDELKNSRIVGEGAFGVVSLCWWRKTQVAVKQMTSSKTITTKALQEFLGEVQIMQNLRPHPNVVLFMGVCVPPQPFCIVTEFCDRGSLLNYLRSSQNIPVEEQFRLISGIALGMLHLHSERIVHRDLAARNVLLSKHLEPKIGDFGMSRLTEAENNAGKTQNDIGPIKWMAPEAISSHEYSIKSDVFSFGVVVWEIVHPKQEPYEDETLMTVAMDVIQGKRLTISETCPPKLVALMIDCWHGSPEMRPDFIQICDRLGNKQEEPAPTMEASPSHGHEYEPMNFDR